MKKGINLLVKQEQYLKFENAFKQLKVVLVVFCLVAVVEYLGLYLVVHRQKQKADELQSANRSLLAFLVQNKEVEANISYFSGKEKQLSSILKSDVNFYPYYQLLTDSLHLHAPEAKLTALTIDSTRSSTFTLEFPNFQSLLTFFRFAESESFLNNFNSLIMSNFTATPGSNQSYQLVFKSVFKQIPYAN